MQLCYRLSLLIKINGYILCAFIMTISRESTLIFEFLHRCELCFRALDISLKLELEFDDSISVILGEQRPFLTPKKLASLVIELILVFKVLARDFERAEWATLADQHVSLQVRSSAM